MYACITSPTLGTNSLCLSVCVILYRRAWPQWISCTPGTMQDCTNNPWSYPTQTANYTLKWVQGAKSVYGLDIDYIGSWNERGYDATYLKTLRTALDGAGFPNTKIIAADSNW